MNEQAPEQPTPPQSPPPPLDDVRTTAEGVASTGDERTLALFAHLLGILGTGFIGPLVIYLIKKNESQYVTEHARDALNFQITVAIAAFVCVPLVYVCIGIPLLMAVSVCDIIFSIMAAIAANKGESYRYPLTIRMVT